MERVDTYRTKEAKQRSPGAPRSRTRAAEQRRRRSFWPGTWGA
jgi:hypothetical protein